MRYQRLVVFMENTVRKVAKQSQTWRLTGRSGGCYGYLQDFQVRKLCRRPEVTYLLSCGSACEYICLLRMSCLVDVSTSFLTASKIA